MRMLRVVLNSFRSLGLPQKPLLLQNPKLPPPRIRQVAWARKPGWPSSAGSAKRSLPARSKSRWRSMKGGRPTMVMIVRNFWHFWKAPIGTRTVWISQPQTDKTMSLCFQYGTPFPVACTHAFVLSRFSTFRFSDFRIPLWPSTSEQWPKPTSSPKRNAVDGSPKKTWLENSTGQSGFPGRLVCWSCSNNKCLVWNI